MKKKLMILMVVTLFITMMFSTGCKKKFDITGTWTLNFNFLASANTAGSSSKVSSMKGYGAAGSTTIIFTGDIENGTFSIPDEGNTGTYSVDGKNVQWIYTNGTTYIGTSSDDNTMAGNIISAYGSGTWTATR
ncbi:MAG: hypothetical protein ABFR36_01495 [Acidobacteriota bacterium]